MEKTRTLLIGASGLVGNEIFECISKENQDIFLLSRRTSDKDQNKFLGKSVNTAVKNINDKISAKLKNLNPDQQENIDKVLLELDGSENKTNLGYGGNIKKCIRYAYKNNFDYAVMLHGDNQYNPKHIQKMLRILIKNKTKNSKKVTIEGLNSIFVINRNKDIDLNQLPILKTIFNIIKGKNPQTEIKKLLKRKFKFE